MRCFFQIVAWMCRSLTGGSWRRWAMPGVAALIAIELGLLSPLSCVAHCFIQQLLAEHAPITFFLCDEHGLAAESGGAADPAPAATLMPQALYELISLAGPLLLAASLLVATLALRPPPRLAPPLIPPPTPPPRLSLA